MYEQYVKRASDIVTASVLIVAFAVPMILLAIWIKIDSQGPAIFKQKRYGRNKKIFTIYKFRSMTTSAPNNIATNSFTDSDSFITRTGRIIRKLSLDELPQLFNVLKGDMSIVGPRPVVLAEKSLISLRDQNGVNRLRPGVTGWAQSNGRDELNDRQKAGYDSHYLENLSLLIDISCIIRTALIIVMLTGHREGHEHFGTEKLIDIHE